MKKELSPAIIGIVIAVVVLVIGFFGWKSLSGSKSGPATKISQEEYRQKMKQSMSGPNTGGHGGGSMSSGGGGGMSSGGPGGASSGGPSGAHSGGQ